MSTAAIEPTGTMSRPLEELPTPEPQAQPKPAAQATAPAYILPRTTNPVMKALLKVPVLMWRLGLKPLLGRGVMILTTTGRKSGLPRRTPLGCNRVNGRKYVITLRGLDTDWYRNLAADPHITIQTADGTEPALARRVTDDEEVWAAYEFLASMPVMKQWAAALGVELSREELVAHKDEFILVAFDPTAEPTPPPLRADLAWVWPAAALVPVGALTVYALARRR
jgi:deazaflavin-dependent oxidoreductase (nitroreductase family)